VNSIWEGAGNIMCPDVVSALSREPDCVDALTSDLKDMSSGCPILTEELSHLSTLARSTPEVLEASARILAQQLVLIAQACAPPILDDGGIGCICEDAPERPALGSRSRRDRSWVGAGGADFVPRPCCLKGGGHRDESSCRVR